MHAKIFRGVHHSMVAAGIAVMLADTVEPWREAHGELFECAFHLTSAFFVAEFLWRLIASPGAPGIEQRPGWRARFAWGLSTGRLLDLLGALPSVLDIVFETRDTILFGLV